MRTAILAGLIALAAVPAAAQQAGDDWDLTEDASQNMMLATVGYSSGQTLAVRCRAGDLDVLISGLPAIEASGRELEATYPDGRVESGGWFTIGDGSLVASPAPRLDARRLRQGGPMKLAVSLSSEPQARRRQYALDLPTGTANLDRVLEACGSGQPDPRENLTRWESQGDRSNMWKRMPQPDYPSGALDVRAGYAVLSCIAAEGGRLTDCRIERESHGRRVGFGESALRSLGAARIAVPADGGPPVGELVITTIRFQITS